MRILVAAFAGAQDCYGYGGVTEVVSGGKQISSTTSREGIVTIQHASGNLTNAQFPRSITSEQSRRAI